MISLPYHLGALGHQPLALSCLEVKSFRTTTSAFFCVLCISLSSNALSCARTNSFSCSHPDLKLHSSLRLCLPFCPPCQSQPPSSEIPSMATTPAPIIRDLQSAACLCCSDSSLNCCRFHPTAGLPGGSSGRSPAVREIRLDPWVREHPLEKETATPPSSILAWKIP